MCVRFRSGSQLIRIGAYKHRQQQGRSVSERKERLRRSKNVRRYATRRSYRVFASIRRSSVSRNYFSSYRASWRCIAFVARDSRLVVIVQAVACRARVTIFVGRTNRDRCTFRREYTAELTTKTEERDPGTRLAWSSERSSGTTINDTSNSEASQ